MKKICTVLLVLCFLLSLCACGQTDPVQNINDNTNPTSVSQTDPSDSTGTADSVTPILYKMTDSAGNRVWFFGSIHVGEEYFYPLPDYVTDAYENSDALAVEFDVVTYNSDIEAQTEALMQMVYLDGTMISDHISEELYTEAVEKLTESGMYMSAFDLYYPILWSTLLDSMLYEKMGVDADLGIDMHFLNDAHETGKEIQEIESGTSQTGMLAGFSEELQIKLLESTLYSYDHLDEMETELSELVKSWANGDEERLIELLNEESEFESEEEELLYAEYTDAMLTQRNIAMAEFAEGALTSGKEVFICVGAAHVVGPGAMVDLLTQRGYTLERIVP